MGKYHTFESDTIDKTWIRNKRHVKVVVLGSETTQAFFESTMTIFSPHTVNMNHAIHIENIDILKTKSVRTLVLPYNGHYVIPSSVTSLDMSNSTAEFEDPNHILEKLETTEHIYPSRQLYFIAFFHYDKPMYACLRELTLYCGQLDLDYFSNLCIEKMSVSCNDVIGEIPPSLLYLKLLSLGRSHRQDGVLEEKILASNLISYTNLDTIPSRGSKGPPHSATKNVYAAYIKGMMSFGPCLFRDNWNKHASLVDIVS
jgi:hypothetical protein